MVQMQQASWDNQKIALLSSAPSAFSEEVISRLERRQWTFLVKTSKISEAFKAIASGRCSVLVINDSPDLPASFILRTQIVDPIAIITPTIIVLHPNHKVEAALVKEIGAPEIVESPLNPATFIGNFEWLIRRWSQGSLRKLYQARRLYVEKQYLPFSKLILSLKQDPEALPFVTPCMAQILMKQADFKGVERLLLNALKEYPRNIGIIVNLVEFYMQAAMPETALKIITATRKNHGNPRMMFSDQIQAHLMLNQVQDCIPLLEELVRENYCRQQASDFLARCLYAEGYKERFENAVAHQAPLIDRFQTKWNKVAS